MKINNFIISTVSIICLYSCAHKSGHGERNDKIVTSQQSQSVLVSPNKKARNVTISVVNNRGDKNKLDDNGCNNLQHLNGCTLVKCFCSDSSYA